jgi:hypothetical protein
VALTRDSLLIRFGAQAVPELVPWPTVYRLEVSRGRASRARNVALGVAAGVLGGLLLQAVAVDTQEYGGDHLERRLLVSGGAGAVIGAGVALSFPGRRRWLEVGRPASP